MNTPLSWIKALVPGLDVTAKEYSDAMTLSGTKVEYFENFDEDVDKIVIGRVKEITQHPDADKLVICQVEIGPNGETTQIVTGAPNVFEGAVVPVVLDGGKVAGGHEAGSRVAGGVEIKSGKLRGVESNGMMCSIEELGRDRNYYPEAPESGLYIFNGLEGWEDLKPGDDAIEALSLHDSLVEYEVTSNRVDCFGILGIAREAAATFRLPFCPPVVKETGNDEKASDYVDVEIKANDLCSRYVARVLKNVKIGPAPLWMQRRLAAVGIRPINNLVDVTNYVMVEYGQPMHAYDMSTIAGNKIVVDRAADGEIFTTLDGIEHTLDHDVLMIRDGEKAVGVAGIMGGENSMINDDVTTVLLEAANFDGTNIRLTSKRLGFRTDASAKFEKGLDPNNAMDAMNRACQLLEEMGAGEVVGGAVDVYPKVKEPIEVPFDIDRCNRLLGTEITMEEVEDYFGRLELELAPDKKSVKVPTWRQDVLRMADLAEEMARFYGYDKIPTTLPSGSATAGGETFAMEIEEVARQTAEQFGFCEAMTYSFESPKVYDKLQLAADDVLRQAIRISNPLGEDFSVMRTLPVGGMLTSLATNYNRRNKDVRLFELANVYLPKALPLTELPDERRQFTLGMYGEGDFFTMKAVVEEFLYKVGMRDVVTYDAKAGKTYLHPGRQALICYEGEVLGYLGEVHPTVLGTYGIGDRVYLAVIDLPKICEKANFTVKYTGIAKFPAVTRDMSLVMKHEVTAGEVEAVIRANGGDILENYELFDIYEGAQILTGMKSMAYSVTFRNKERTLSDQEVNDVMAKILDGLAAIGVTLRQ